MGGEDSSQTTRLWMTIGKTGKSDVGKKRTSKTKGGCWTTKLGVRTAEEEDHTDGTLSANKTQSLGYDSRAPPR